VTSAIHYRFPDGQELVSTNRLRFRTLAALERSLADAGFSVERVAGDWDGRPFQPDSPEMIFVAARAEAPGAGSAPWPVI
jgi:hypothetical protein